MEYPAYSAPAALCPDDRRNRDGLYSGSALCTGSRRWLPVSCLSLQKGCKGTAGVLK